MTSDQTNAASECETVYFDGSCPLCSREIALYKRARGANTVVWHDVSKVKDGLVSPDLTASEAMARFHVRRKDGHLVSGAAAFGHLWTALPGFRLAGRAALFPPVTFVLERLYRLFLPIRRAMLSRFKIRHES